MHVLCKDDGFVVCAEVARAYEAHNALEALVYRLRDTVRAYGAVAEEVRA